MKNPLSIDAAMSAKIGRNLIRDASIVLKISLSRKIISGLMLSIKISSFNCTENLYRYKKL